MNMLDTLTAVTFDKETEEWFKLHPYAQETIEECPMCGKFFIPEVGHKCRCMELKKCYEKWIKGQEASDDQNS